MQQNHKESSFIVMCVKTMNDELSLYQCSKLEKFHIKQRIILLAREFIALGRIRYLKKPEMWSHAICLKAVRDTIPEHFYNIFPRFSKKQWKKIENKRWKLDSLIK